MNIKKIRNNFTFKKKREAPLGKKRKRKKKLNCIKFLVG